MDHAVYRRFILATALVPVLALATTVVAFWPHVMTPQDAVVFAVMYALAGAGVTVGFHRHLTHRSFRTHKPVRAALAVLGTMAAEGPVITWVAHHRHHHTMSDEPGDPHSPHHHGRGVRAALKGLWHAHMGWLVNSGLSSEPMRYAPDLAGEREMRWISRNFVAIVVAGIVAGGLFDLALTGTFEGFARGLLWGGLIRIFAVNHSTYAINSICHYFGRQRFETGDESRNVAWLALPSFGEAWHNNHHAFPTAARHGYRWYELDISAGIIRLMELTGLAWDVVRVPDGRAQEKLASPRRARLSGRHAG